jgi:hypothetical protein
LIQTLNIEAAAKNIPANSSSRASIHDKSKNKKPQIFVAYEANDIRLRRAIMEIREKKEKHNNRQSLLIKEQTLQ